MLVNKVKKMTIQAAIKNTTFTTQAISMELTGITIKKKKSTTKVIDYGRLLAVQAQSNKKSKLIKQT